MPHTATLREPAASRPPHRTIAWIIRGDESYGVRQGTLSLLRGLRALGWSTLVVALRRGDTASACERMGCATHYLEHDLTSRPEGGTLGKAVHFVAHQRETRNASKSVSALLRPMNPDGVNFCWPDLVTLAGQVAKSLRAPCFWHMPTVIRDGRFLGVPVVSLFYQWQCRRYGILPLANSRAVAATLGDLWVKPVVLHLGVDVHRFDPGHVKALHRGQLGIPSGATVLGIFARLCPFKGQDRVFQSVLATRGMEPGLHLLLLGGPCDAPFAQSIRQAAAAADASHILHFAGEVQEPERYYGAVDLPVNACVAAEPFGLSVVEAMMMGKPVLVHALGGPAETVIDGVTGWHVPDASVEALARGIRRALDDRPRWPTMGTQARKHAIENYSTDAYCSRYVQIVERTLANLANR